MPLMAAANEGYVERVFPIRIELHEGRRDHGQRGTQHNNTPHHTTDAPSTHLNSYGTDIEAPKTCHGRTKAKFDGPKIWGQSDDVKPKISADDDLTSINHHIQSFGAVVALHKIADRFETIAVSQNATKIIDLSKEELFGPHCFSRFLHRDTQNEFRFRLQDMGEEALNTDHRQNIDPEIFSVWIVQHSGQTALFWCTIHATQRDPSVLVCEFEKYLPFLNQPKFISTPRAPTRRLNHIPTAEEYLKATNSKSKPLRYSHNGLPSGRDSTAHPISLLNQVQRQYSAASSIAELYDAIVGTVSELTRFDRIMVYRFDECKCGAVVGELLNPEASKDVFLGLHFPSSDVPISIRELYKYDRVQILRQKSEPTSPIVDNEGNGVEIDLSRCYLRSFSPEQVTYFSRMNVTSAMSISLIVDNDLWGLVMCHSYDSEITTVSPPLKELCRSIGNFASTHVERLLMKEKMEMRSSLMSGLSLQSPTAFLASDSTTLLSVFAAEFGLLTLNGEARAIGKIEAYQEALALVHYFRARSPTKVISSQKISTDFPDLNFEPGFQVLAGVLVIPLSDSGADFLTLFRKGQLLEIFWAGNEQEQFQYIGGEVPEPTAGLLRWAEHMNDTSREWTDDQMDIATVISLLYGTFIRTSRQKEAIEESSRVKRLLISNASHEVRTPLNSIINCLEIILDGDSIDDSTREQLGQSLFSSKSLIYAINDLLDLTRVATNDPILMNETFDFRSEINNLVDTFRHETDRKGLQFSAELSSDILPNMVRGDPLRLRQAISNILSNAVESTLQGTIKFEVDVLQRNDIESTLQITISDQGIGMSEAQLDSLFQDLEHIVEDDGSDNTAETDPSIGLGLAVVARYTRNCQGQLKMQSKLGTGTNVQLCMTLLSADSNARTRFLDTPPSDQAMADLLQNIEERAAMIENAKYRTKKKIEPIVTSMTDPFSGGPLTSPSSIHSSQASVLGFSPTAERRDSRGYPFPTMKGPEDKLTKLRILVAEDNPLNSKILNMRLGKMGHHVTLTPDGQACVDIFTARSDEFDVILMDIQMPLLDGNGSTKAIRQFERSSTKLSEYATDLDRIPIFAVSASLLEDLREEYMATGFDGWIMKPIDFKRLNFLMRGIYDEDARRECQYRKGEFEAGGWFTLD